MVLVDRLTGLLRRVRFRQWDVDGGPTSVLRLAMRGPLVTTVVVAGGLAGVFAAVFGVPPVSPLVLVVIVVAPLYPWLRSERRLYREWLERDPDVPREPDEERDPDVPREPDEEHDPDVPNGSSRTETSSDDPGPSGDPDEG